MNVQAFEQWLSTFHGKRFAVEPLIVGVLNITPDSFSDGGKYLSPKHAIDRAWEMIEQGVDIIDIGAESSRPGAKPIDATEELSRLLPVLSELTKRSNICLSIDTYKPQVMKEAVGLGVHIINDIHALRYPGALQTAAELKKPVCLMHMLGEPQSMQKNLNMHMDMVKVVNQFFSERIKTFAEAGIDTHHIILDIGFGFGKSLPQNMALLQNIKTFETYKMPLLLGVSRKHSLGLILNKPESDRVIGGISMATYAMLNHVAMIRTHDIEQTYDARKIVQAILNTNFTDNICQNNHG